LTSAGGWAFAGSPGGGWAFAGSPGAWADAGPPAASIPAAMTAVTRIHIPAPLLFISG
jgi:hypothetical protein